jgi:hypothetical protein
LVDRGVELPLYRLVINDDDHTGVTAVALVDEPAIQINWQAFNSKKQLFQVTDTEKRIVSGPLMVADMKIYRRDEKRGEYNVYFDAPTIEQIVLKFFKNQYTKNVNPMHDSMLLLPDVFMFESFIVDSLKGKLAPVGFELSDGSWFGSFKVNNDEIWNDFIKTGIFKGFSVEGFFNEEPVEELDIQDIEKIAQLIS